MSRGASRWLPRFVIVFCSKGRLLRGRKPNLVVHGGKGEIYSKIGRSILVPIYCKLEFFTLKSVLKLPSLKRFLLLHIHHLSPSFLSFLPNYLGLLPSAKRLTTVVKSTTNIIVPGLIKTAMRSSSCIRNGLYIFLLFLILSVLKTYSPGDGYERQEPEPARLPIRRFKRTILNASEPIKKPVHKEEMFISVKTTGKFHESRVRTVVDTWFQLAPKQVKACFICFYCVFCFFV